MSYKIVVDSCCDLIPEKKADPHYHIVPLTLEVGDRSFVDDVTFDQRTYLDAMKASSQCPKSACPSPEAYCKAFEGPEDMVFVITLSEHLSGSYNSAVIGKNLFEEEHEGTAKKIHVFSSDSACVGEALPAYYAQELAEAGEAFETIVEKISTYIKEMGTFFVLENLETLRKNGRLTGLAALVVTALQIKPVMSAEGGVIIKLGQSRGLERALRSMVEHAAAHAKSRNVKRIGITHVNCPERAEKVKAMLLEKLSVEVVDIVNAAGVSTTYADEGGIVVAL